MLYHLYSMMMKAASALYRETVHRLRIRPLLKTIDVNAVILEIGGGYNAYFTKDKYGKAYHLDHCSTDELRSKYASDVNVAHLAHRVQAIDFVFKGSPIETVIPQELRFDVIFSSHALEHQVDLVGHLKSLETLLKPDGKIIMIIPDYRCCFDALRFPTVAADAIAVHLRSQRIHKSKEVFEAISRTISVNPGRRIRGPDMAAARFAHTLESALEAAVASERPDAEYRDIHAWTFCPVSFHLLMTELYLLRLTSLSPVFISPQYGNQFCVVLASNPPGSGDIGPKHRGALERTRWALTKKLRH